MQVDVPDPDPNGITGRVALLHDAYRSTFSIEFDMESFRADDFYAFQVLEKAISEGSPELREAALALQELRLALLDGTETIDFAEPPVPRMPARRAYIAPVKAAPPPTPENERRNGAVRGSGHVRLGNKEIVLLSQMRIQYRKTFGTFFEIFDFTGNDLYARSLLSLCLESGNTELAAMARQFLDDKGKPRFHRRKGTADVDIAS